MEENIIRFDSIIFDKEHKTFTILNGTEGTYSYSDIDRCSVQCEDSKYRGKTTPFKHVVLSGVTMVILTFEPSIYVGVKITMKDGDILGVYVSKEKTRMNTDLYHKDKEEADKIKRLLDKAIEKYATPDNA